MHNFSAFARAISPDYISFLVNRDLAFLIENLCERFIFFYNFAILNNLVVSTINENFEIYLK